MSHFWFKTDQGNCTVTGPELEAAKDIARDKGRTSVELIATLPYPSGEQLNNSGCPSFCFAKPECFNRGSCPRNYACDD